LASPVLDEVIQSVNETLKDFYERLAQDYIEHLKALIEQQTQKKDEVSAQLSDDERTLQADNDWFTAFQEKLHEIERG
jgi:DNA replication initiation complex subunit (GINS family)